MGRIAAAMLWPLIALGAASAADLTIPDGDVAALKAAMVAANGNGEADTIRLASGGTYLLTAVDNTDGDKGPNGLPVVTDDHLGTAPDLRIVGGGATLERSGSDEFRFLMIGRDATAILHGIHFRNGRCPKDGGAIQARWKNGDLTLDDCTFESNSVSGTGPEDGGGAVMAHESTLRVKNCRFLNNEANVGGALKILLSDLTVAGSTFQGNRALHTTSGAGGGIYIDGALGDDGTIRVTESRFLDNSAIKAGGGFFNFLYNNNVARVTRCYFTRNTVSGPSPEDWASGGGFWTRGGTITLDPGWSDGAANDTRTELVNCTFYRNKVLNTQGLGGGIATGGMNTTAANLTLAENEAGWGGGGIHASDTFRMTNTLLYQNRAFNGGNDWNDFHQFSGESESIDGGGNLHFLTEGGSGLPDTVPGADPLLTAPADNGGPVETMAIDPGGPAVDGGLTDAAPAWDGRRIDRPFGPAADIGAYEHAPTVADLTVSTAGYLGGDGDDGGNAVAIQSDKTIVAGGRFSDLPRGGTHHILPGADAADEGALLRLSPDGKRLLTITRLGGVVDDLDIDPADDAILAVGDFGLVKLSSDGSTRLWEKPLVDFDYTGSGLVDGDAAFFGNGRRVATAADGTVAAQFNEWYFIFDRAGNEISRRLIVREDTDKAANPYGVGGYNHRVEDIAIDSGNRLVFVAGWSQRSSTYQSAYLTAFSYTETGDDGRDRSVWTDYNWWNSAAGDTGLTADNRGVRVEMGRDGRLRFTGYADGGNNIFTRNPKYLSSEKHRAEYVSTTVNNVAIDRFNNGAGAGAGQFAYFMTADPATGEIDAGQFQYSSAGINEARSFIIYALAADAAGNVLIGGRAADAMPGRADLRINGIDIGPRVDNENSLIGISPTFGNRTLVACWTGPTEPGRSRITALAGREGLWVALGETDGRILTVDPLDGEKNAGTDVFFSVWGDPVPTAPPPGDVDCSRTLDLADVMAALQLLSGGALPSDGCDPLNGDLNGNERLDLGDAVGLLQAVARGRSN